MGLDSLLQKVGLVQKQEFFKISKILALSVLSLFLIPTILVAPAKFGVIYTLANVLALASTTILVAITSPPHLQGFQLGDALLSLVAVLAHGDPALDLVLGLCSSLDGAACLLQE
ncbi:hypothetical protein PAPYR_10667 [Paratrimastix pyriformis]|uniref:Amino acid transporter transmembrane domain-containing protein n=1 Tax=Paratrimastix pyriformis TaxID=342808 RepID=A0ABQ8U5F8_9EUKA|nr:hypothetical protein PAPYR_10667 [Paratrimastix pyriformis]